MKLIFVALAKKRDVNAEKCVICHSQSKAKRGEAGSSP